MFIQISFVVLRTRIKDNTYLVRFTFTGDTMMRYIICNVSTLRYRIDEGVLINRGGSEKFIKSNKRGVGIREGSDFYYFYD